MNICLFVCSFIYLFFIFASMSVNIIESEIEEGFVNSLEPGSGIEYCFLADATSLLLLGLHSV